MGSVFSSPKPPAPVIVAPTPIAEPVEEKQPEQAEEKKKDDNKQGDSRRGRAATIATSYNGVLDEAKFSVKRKKLLGE